MADKQKRTRVDPELIRQLDEASPADRPVQAVVFLRSGRKSAPDEVTDEAHKVIEAAKSRAGTEPSRVNVMRNLGTVAVEGPASFVRALIDESEVASALANVHPDDDAGIGVPSAPSAEHAAATTDNAAATHDAAAAANASEAERPELTVLSPGSRSRRGSAAGCSSAPRVGPSSPARPRR